MLKVALALAKVSQAAAISAISTATIVSSEAGAASPEQNEAIRLAAGTALMKAELFMAQAVRRTLLALHAAVLLSKHDLTCRRATLKATLRQLQQDRAQAAAAGAAHAGAVFNSAAREKDHAVEMGEEVTSRWHLEPDMHPQDTLVTQLCC